MSRHEVIAALVDEVVEALAAPAGDDEVPWAAARVVAEEREAQAELAQRYDEAAEGQVSSEAAAALLSEAADLHRRTGHADAAIASYRRALGIRPEADEIRERLESLYTETERWRELAALLEERIDPRLGTQSPAWSRDRAGHLRRLARVYDEKLGRPREAAATLERLSKADAAPDDLAELAALHAKLGRWRPMLETLTRLAELTRGTVRATEARRWIAEIYADQLQLPDQAIEAYRAVLAEAPHDVTAWNALAALLERRQRWQELATLLKARAARVEAPPERADLLRRCARVMMDFLGRPGEAAALLREARSLTPKRTSLAGELVSALREQGKPREAVAELEHQVAQGGPPEQIAGLLLQIAALRADELRDRAGARRVLESLLERFPDHLAARRALADLEQQVDPRAYAEARRRQAATVSDPGVKATLLLDAATVLRDRAGDAAGARAILEEALAAGAGTAEVVATLIELRAEAGDRGAVRTLLEQRLASELAPEERARVLTELAELALAPGAADRPLAERRLVEALDADRDHTPALRLLGDLLSEDGRHAELVDILEARLPDLDEQPPELRAEVERRIGLALDELSRPDEAYEHLRRADAVVRNDLLTKLALGENRFRAGRWREAAQALQDLGTHPDAPQHAVRVAEALAHAAEAEVRSLRPERARGQYEAALSLDPSCRPALRALTEIALQAKDLERAAELLEWEATTTSAPDRAERFQALGDLLRERLDQPGRAAAAYRHAIASLDAIDESHTALLANLLSCQRASDDVAGTADTLELLASAAGTPAARVGFLCEASAVQRSGGDLARARVLADEALRVDPLDEEAVTLASELAADARDWVAVCSMLPPALVSWERIDRGQTDRAMLWTRLGDARRERGDARGALAAFQRAVEVSRDPATAVPARRRLAAQLGSDPAAVRTATAHLRAVVAVDPDPADILALAHLLPASVEPLAIDRRRELLRVATALGAQLDASDRGFLEDHPERPLAADQAYRGVLPDTMRMKLILDPDDEPLATVLGLLAQAAATLWPTAASARAPLELADEQRGSAAGGASRLYTRIARALGAPDTVVHTRDVPHAVEVAVVCAFPPLVVIGASLSQLPEIEQRFLLGRAAELVRRERLAATGLPLRQFMRLVTALGPAVGATPPVEPDAALEAEIRRVRAALSVPLRTRLFEVLRGIPADQLDPTRYRAACERAADRAGLLVAGDTAAALRFADTRGPIDHLVTVAVTEDYVAARAQLGLG